MAKKSWGIISAVCLAAVIGLAFGLARLDVANDRNSDSADLDALQNRLQSLEAQLANTRGRETERGLDTSPDARLAREKSKDMQAKPALTEPTPGASVPGAGHQGKPEDAQSAAERRQREAGVLENALANEVLDVAATNTFTQSLKESLVRDEFAGTQIVNAECRASLCRVVVLHNSSDDMEKFLGSIQDLEAFSDSEAYWQQRPNADGSSSMTLFVARQGHQLPQYAMR